MARACCPSVLTATKRIVGRLAASAIASASVTSFFLALDEGFDIGGWDQSNLMPEIPDGSPPVMRTPTGFQGDDAARLLGKEAENFFSGELFGEPNAAVGKGAMRLERPLCKIETDNANLLHGC